jgi:hypothetical protein
VTLSGAQSESTATVAALGLLFCLAVSGGIYWLEAKRGHDRWTGFGICVAGAVTSVVALGFPLLGVSTVLPSRWFVFLVPLLAILGAPALAVMTGDALRPIGGGRRQVAVVLVVLLVVAPLALFNVGSANRSVDGPYFDDAPSAERYATNATEADLYRFVNRHAPGRDTRLEDTLYLQNESGPNVVADHVARQVISRHYGHAATYYRRPYAAQTTDIDTDMLLVYRAYARTAHVSWDIVYREEVYRVYGPLPGPRTRDDVVYTNGYDRLVYRNGSSG